MKMKKISIIRNNTINIPNTPVTGASGEEAISTRQEVLMSNGKEKATTHNPSQSDSINRALINIGKVVTDRFPYFYFLKLLYYPQSYVFSILLNYSQTSY